MAISTGLEQGFKGDHLKPDGYRKNTFSLLLSTLAISILSLALPIMTLQIYDRILPNPGTGTLPVLITGVCLAILLEALLRLTRAFTIGRSGAAYEHRLACKAMDKILGADLSRMGSYGIGEHIHRMGSVGKLKDFYNGYSLTVLAELAFVPLLFALIVYIAHYLAIIPAVILGLFIIVSLWKGYTLRSALQTREKYDDKRFNFLIETLEGVHTLKAFALEKFFERRYEMMEEESARANYTVTQQTARTFNIGAIFSHIMVTSVISVGAWLVLQGQLSTGALIATLLLSGRMMQPVQKALALWTRYQDYSLARKHLEDLFSTPQQQFIQQDDAADNLADGRIDIRDVSFKHQNDNDTTLENINLTLKRGDSILISGVHGCGKTTLLNVIAGIIPPSQGDITIDNIKLSGYSPETLVKHVGFIRTQPLIFRGTIRDNITCFGQIKESAAKEIASLLKVDRDVAALPGGFDTFLNGNNTDSIPVGLMQRIAMVRVLATKPRIILFDNADRSLDEEGYAMIYSLLARLKGRVSMILISDDRNIRGLADYHYLLNNKTLEKADDEFSKGNIRPYKELRL